VTLAVHMVLTSGPECNHPSRQTGKDRSYLLSFRGAPAQGAKAESRNWLACLLISRFPDAQLRV